MFEVQIMDSWERKSRRVARLSELIQKEVAGMLARGEIKDPRVRFVTVMAAKVTEDIQNCFIYVSAFGSEKEEASAIEGLNRASSFIRGLLAKRLVLRRVPKLEFFRDESSKEARKVDEILDRIKAEGSTNVGDDEGSKGES